MSTAAAVLIVALAATFAVDWAFRFMKRGEK